MANNSEGIMARYKKYLTNQQKKKLRSLYAGYQQTTADERREAYLQARKAADRSAAAASAMGLGGGYEARKQAAANAELDKYGLQLNRQADAAFESNAVVPMANQTIKAQNEAARKAYERKRKAAQRAYQDALNKQAQQQTARLTKQERDRLKYYRYGQQYMDDALTYSWSVILPKTTPTTNPRSNTHNRDKAYQYAQEWVDEAGATRPKTKRERNRAKANRYAQDWAGNAPKESPLKKNNGSAVNPKFDISPKQPVVLPPKYAIEVEARVKDIAPNDVPQVKLDYLNEVNQYANLLQGLNEAYKPVGKMQDLANQYQQLVRDISDPTLSVAQRKQASVLAQQLEQEYREAYNSFNANKAGLQYLQNRVEKAYGMLQTNRAVLSRLGVEMTEDDIGFNTGWAKTHGYIPETPEELFIATRDLIDNETKTTDEFWKRAKNNSAVLFGYGDESGNYKNALGESTIPEEERKLVLDSQDEAWMRENGFGWVIDGVAQMLENSNQYATFAQAAKAFLEQKEADEWQYFEERNVRRVLNRFNEIDDSEKETVMSEGAKQTGIDLDRWDDIHARWEGVSNYKFETDEDGQVHAVWKKTGNFLKDNALNRNAGNYMGGNIAAGMIEKKLGLPSRYLNTNTLAIMTKEDAAFINYCYGMGDKETARQYIYQLAEFANQLVGKEKADKIAELPWGIRFAREAMDQFSYGVSSFHTGLVDVFTNHRTPTTVKEVKSSAITENQRERGWGGAADVINPALVSAGNMAPSVALGLAGGAAAGALSNTAAGASTLGVLATEGLSHAGTISMGLSAGGKAKQEALRMGYGKDAANVYGIINGISETCLQEIMGGVVTLGQPQWLEALGDSILNSVKNPVARVMVRQALNAASETTEEVMQDILDPVFKGVSLNEKYLNDHPEAKQLLNTALSTVISTLLMNGMGGDMLNTAKTETAVQRLSESYGLSVADARFMLNTYSDLMNREGGNLDIEDYNKFNELASVIESNLPASVIDKIQKGETDLISYGASRYGAESGKLDRNIAKLSEGKQTETIDATDHTAELANLKGKAKARYLIDASPTGKIGNLYFTTTDGKAIDVKNMGLKQKTNFNIAQKLAKAFPNIKIVAHDNLYGIDGVNHVVEGQSPEIHVSLNGSAMVMTTAAHELLHQVEKTDAKAYKNIQSYLTTLLDESEIATTEKNVASKYGIEYTVDEKGNKVFKDEKAQKTFESEVAAHLVEKVLTDDSFLDRIIRDSDPKNRTVRAKLINGLKDVIDRVTKALRGEPTVSGKLCKLQRTIEKAYREMSKADLTATKTETEEADFEAVERKEKQKEEAPATEEKSQLPITDATNEAEAEDASVSYRIEDDPNTLRELNNGKTVKVYRAMQLIDGKLYPPMAAKVKDESGKATLQIPTEFNQWYRSDERPDLVDEKGKFRLNKGNGSSIDAAYNPYWHTSASPLNDQFSSAWNRPNLVVVEGEIPASELTSGYKADKAKDSVGETKWHAGPVASKLKGDKARRVFLSRWFRATRVVSDAEVASIVADTLRGEDVSVPSNVVTPSLLAELRKQGVPIEEIYGKGGAKSQWRIGDYPVTNAGYMNAIEDGDMDAAKEILEEAANEAMPNSKAVDKNGRLMRFYHGTKEQFNEFKRDKIGSTGRFEGSGFNFTPSEARARSYGGNVLSGYIDIQKPLSASKKTITVQQLAKIIRETDPTGDNIIANYAENTNDYGKPSFINRESLHAARMIWEYADSDVDIYSDISSADPDAEGLIQAFEKLGYDGLIHYDTNGNIKTVVTFNSHQFKLADVTRDDNGNVIPLYDRFNTDEEDIRYRVSDTEYLSLAEKYRDGTATEEEKAELEKRVEEAARKAGYTIKAYHGTYAFGRTKFTDYGGALFLTDNPDVGRAFSGSQPIRQIASQVNPDTMSMKDAVKWFDQNLHWGEKHIATEEDFAKELDRLKPLTEAELKMYGLNSKANDDARRNQDIVKAKLERFRNGETFYYFDFNGINKDYANSPLADIEDFRRMVRDYGISKDRGGGVYEMFVKPGKIIEVDAKGSYYANIPLPYTLQQYASAEQKQKASVSSDELVRLAYLAGYDTLAIKNVIEGGDYGYTAKGTDYVVMNAPSQIKSADPVTYDSNGDIIPLSERFNEENEDIRYRISDYSEDETIVGTPIDTAAVRRAVKTGKEQTTKDGYTVKIDTGEGNKYTVTVSRDGEVINTREGVANEELKGADIERAAAALMRNIKKGRKEHQYSDEGVNAQGKNYANQREADARLAERMHEGAIRARVERKAGETEQAYRERVKKIYEDRYRREIKNTALKWNKRLVDMLARPTENKHVPVQLARSVAEFCEEVTKYLDGTTKRGEKILDKIRKAYDRAFTDEQTILRAKSEDAGYDARGAVLNTSQKDEQLAKMLKELSEITAEKSFAELTRDEMDALLNVVRGVAFTVTDANKMIGEAEGKTVWQAGSTMIEQLENAPKVSTKLRGYFATSLDLRRLARIFSGSNENAEFVKLVEQLNQGAIEKERVAQELQAIFKPVTDKYGNEIKKWYGRKAEWIDAGVDKNGVIFKITKGMRVSLALHVLNEGNMRHIERGGLTIPEAKLYAQGKLADAYANGKLVRLTAKQINDIIANMTEAEKAYVEAAKQLFHDRAGFYVNKTSLQLVGYTKANVENYFPIHTDKNFNKTDFASMSMDGSIEGQGFLKERVAASNPVYLEDITSVVNRQIRGVALYAGMAIPVRNFNAVMNAAVYEDENGDWVPRTSVKQTLAKTMGTYGAKVVEGFVEDASEMSQRVDVTPVERIAGKLATNYVKAVLLGNLKVAMKQVASYPTAAAVIPWKYLNKALAAGGRNRRIISRADVDLINKYTPLYQMRREGNANEVASLMNKPGMEDKLPWLLGWITKMDVMTVGRLWSAAEYMVEDTHKDLAKGSDEFYREVAKVFNQTIQQTQPNFTPLQRSAALRSKNPIVRSLTLFGTQRMQNGGIMIEAAYELKQAKGKSAEEIAAARRKLGRAVASQVAQNVLLLAATLVVDALRGRMKQWQDDDDELTLESIGKKMGDTFLSNFLGSFLGGSEFYETISNMYKKANGQTTYDTEFSVPALDAIETIMSFGQSGIPNFINYLNGDHTDEEKLNKLKSFSMELAKVAGYATGLPLENAVKDVFKGFIPAYKDIRDWKKTGELIPYLWQSGKLDSTTTRRRYEEWIDGGRKGSQFFALDEKLKGISGGRDGRAAILREMDDLTPEDKAFLMEMYDNSEGYAEGSKFFNKNGKELYDFAAEPAPEAEVPAKAPAETPEAVPAEPENDTAPDLFTEATNTVKKMNAEESTAYLNTTSFTSEEKYQILAKADKNDPRAKNAEAFHATYGLSYDDMWDVHSKYNSETFHGYDFQKYVDGKKGLKGRQKFALVELANTQSAWLEKAQSINSKMGISYDTLWKIKLYWSGESGQGKKARITAYCKSLGLKQSQIDKLYDFRFLT